MIVFELLGTSKSYYFELTAELDLSCCHYLFIISVSFDLRFAFAVE